MPLAPVTWVVISESLPNRIRGTAVSVAAALWIGSFVLIVTLPKRDHRHKSARIYLWAYFTEQP
ncbi:MAG: hypothetical protein DMG70_12680 [Acidobacteria bacterium]|nr:MAG: hypothetical protein DMG70_12680 [Acidobacteriota bacterium]PYY05212.1 MAG: hypothetical protein DMG69_27785 [Acidobacteriota bacterium]